ncbi:MAG: hypothetical protein LBD20_05310 [Spirochaetaceae bacterium]|jgi:hypothetical protein|nr:hypothetical protein [Spirochaetaceae bacterium]
MYEHEAAFYEANRFKIREKYLGKQVVISGDKIVGAYDNVGDAYRETIKTLPLGTFMIHDVPKNIEDEIQWLSPFVL